MSGQPAGNIGPVDRHESESVQRPIRLGSTHGTQRELDTDSVGPRPTNETRGLRDLLTPMQLSEVGVLVSEG